ncbi:MAG: hypothetical protein JSU70_23275 [Phycisphaerales bacterium]|nr:MAG: hypothetical protein JSU70_23275 [Phycisphaerales bacterium]
MNRSENSRSNRFVYAIILVGPIAMSLLLCAAAATQARPPTEPVLRHSEVVFMYAADNDAYRAYNATFVAWGGAKTPAEVKRHHDIGVRCTGSMWCLTAGAENIHKNAALREACAVDIEGKPVEVPWLFDHTYRDTKTYFGCTNHPEFRSLCRQRVREAMAGKADGLHVDDHLGTAGAAWWQGGGFCDWCVKAFREYLKEHADKGQLEKASVSDLETFDYRELVRKYAKTRAEYKKVQHEIPLMDLFLDFQATAATEHTRQLGLLAAEVAGHPVLLSANACIPNRAHEYVVKNLTHIVCEVRQNAAAGVERIDHAIEAYRLAAKLGRPLAATASGQDWAFVKQQNCEELVRFWIALAYAHGQRFMVPHPNRQWCFSNELGTHWYAAPVEAYAPMYRFIRARSRWFDGFEAVELKQLNAPDNILCTARRNADSGQVVLHVLNRNYDKGGERFDRLPQAKISFEESAIAGGVKQATIMSYDAPEREVPVGSKNGEIEITLADLKLWSLVVFD